ncbi:MAG TPA: DUF3040 domain-containing protein [Acidimicrobiales bacterium]|nr:DUF3040 domain-containing protein [Acidimicrobiales bacterium]
MSTPSPLDDRALQDLASALLADDPALARRLRRGPQHVLHRARWAAVALAGVSLVVLLSTAAAGALAVAVLAAVALVVLTLFSAAVSVLLFVSQQEAAGRLAR